MLVKDKIKEYKDKLTELVYKINNKRKYKEREILVPILILARIAIIKTIEQNLSGVDYHLDINDTVYKYFIRLDENIQNNIINNLIKDIEKSNIINSKPTRDKILTTIADEDHITDSAIADQLEKNYLVFITSFIVLLLKSVIYNVFSEEELNTEIEKSLKLTHKVNLIRRELKDLIKTVEDYS